MWFATSRGSGKSDEDVLAFQSSAITKPALSEDVDDGVKNQQRVSEVPGSPIRIDGGDGRSFNTMSLAPANTQLGSTSKGSYFITYNGFPKAPRALFKPRSPPDSGSRSSGSIISYGSNRPCPTTTPPSSIGSAPSLVKEQPLESDMPVASLIMAGSTVEHGEAPKYVNPDAEADVGEIEEGDEACEALEGADGDESDEDIDGDEPDTDSQSVDSEFDSEGLPLNPPDGLLVCGSNDNFFLYNTAYSRDHTAPNGARVPFADCSEERLQALCNAQWGDDSMGVFNIHDDIGGSYNQVYGVSFTSKHTQKKQEYVIRVPRPDTDPAGRVLSSVANSELVRRTQPRIPVPKVVAWDPSDQNKLQQPYAIYERAEGKRVDIEWDDWNHQQKLSLARQFADIFNAYVLGPQYDVCGRIDPSSVLDAAGGPRILEFDSNDSYNGTPVELTNKSDSSPAENRGLKCILEYVERCNNPADYRVRREKRSRQIKALKELIDDVDFGDMPNILCHLDLEPRNIMAATVSDTEVKITAILDWDSAVVAPQPVACRPPMWLYLDRKHNHFSDREQMIVAWCRKLSPRRTEIKNAFEEHLDSKVKHMASDPKFCLMRRLCLSCIRGLKGERDWNYTMRILRDWSLSRAYAAARLSRSKSKRRNARIRGRRV